ncbi:MAG: monooxygenase [Myxococcota bacterium]
MGIGVSRRGSALVVTAVVVAGCTGKSAAPEATTPEPTVTYHHHVRPILESRCVGCHTAGGIGPFPLTTFEETWHVRDLILHSVVRRTMPPWPPAQGCTDYLGDPSLSDGQIATIQRWVDGGGPAGTEVTTLSHATEPPRLSRVDLTLRMPVDYLPQQSPDDYRCFILDWPEDEVSYVSGFRAHPGNASVVHHVIAYSIPPQLVDDVLALDDADTAPGYECFGGPGVMPRSVGARPGWLGAWAPGGQGSDYPAGTGVRVAPDSKVALQIHYNVSSGDGLDRTEVEFKLDSHVEREALVLPFANPDWFRGVGMDIPAGGVDVMHTFAFDVTGFMSMLSEGHIPDGPVRVYSAALHMHMLGRSGWIGIQRAGGEYECMLDIPRWDFHWQNSYGFVEPKTVHPGDLVNIECHWDNNAPDADDVRWGEGTGEEMCLGILYVTAP